MPPRKINAPSDAQSDQIQQAESLNNQTQITRAHSTAETTNETSIHLRNVASATLTDPEAIDYYHTILACIPTEDQTDECLMTLKQFANQVGSKTLSAMCRYRLGTIASFLSEIFESVTPKERAELLQILLKLSSHYHKYAEQEIVKGEHLYGWLDHIKTAVTDNKIQKLQLITSILDQSEGQSKSEILDFFLRRLARDTLEKINHLLTIMMRVYAERPSMTKNGQFILLETITSIDSQNIPDLEEAANRVSLITDYFTKYQTDLLYQDRSPIRQSCYAIFSSMNSAQLKMFLPFFVQYLQKVEVGFYPKDKMPFFIPFQDHHDFESKLSILSAMAPFMDQMSQEQRLYAAISLLRIQTHERTETFALLYPHLLTLKLDPGTGKPDQRQFEILFHHISQIPKERRAAILTLTTKVFGVIREESQLYFIANSLTHLNIYNDLMQRFDSLWERLSDIKDPKERFLFITTICSFRRHNIEELLAEVGPFLQNISFGQHQILRIHFTIPEEERASLYQDILFTINGYINGYIRSLDMQEKTHYRKELGSKEGQDFFSSYWIFLMSLDTPTPGYTILEEQAEKARLLLIRQSAIATHMHLVPLSMANQCLDYLQDVKNQHPDNLATPHQIKQTFALWFRTNARDLHTHWREQMQFNPDKRAVRKITKFITENVALLNLDEVEENGIVQLAIRTSILLLDENADHRNPYVIFKRLEEKRAVPAVWEAIAPTEEILNGEPLAFNPLFFESELRNIIVRYADLHKGSPHFIESHLSALEARFESTAGLMNQVQILTGFAFHAIKEHAINDGFLAHLLTFTSDNPEAIVPILTARFFAIAHYIESLSQEQKPGEPFSEQEFAFIKMLASIMLCTTGKSDGINGYYFNILPPAFRYGAVQTVTTKLADLGHEQSRLFICEILAEEIEKMFSADNPMMKSIAGLKPQQKIEQGSHQGLFLRNLVGKDLLVSSQLSFDAHTQLLYDKLIALTKQDALQFFFTYFRPIQFAQVIANKFDLSIEETVEELKRMGLFR